MTSTNSINSHTTKLLVIDDDNEVRYATAIALERAGYVVIQGATAEEAVTLTLEHQPALVLLDVVLPDGDGRDVAKKLKANAELNDVFIILLSGVKISPEDQQRGLTESLADGYIVHPVQPKILCGWVEAFLRLRATQLTLRETIQERDKLIKELQDAMDNIKTLKGLIPICSNCKRIRDDQGYWNILEAYIATHTDAELTHGVCPECAKVLYGDAYEKAVNRIRQKNNKD